MISVEQLNQIKNLGIEIDHQQAFGGKSKGNQHLYRVVKLACHIARIEGAQEDITEAGAWLHDTALPSGDDYDYENNRNIVLGILSQVSIEDHDKEAVAECVASHEGTSQPKTLEAQIVHDADVLEKAGILGVIRHTWKLTNKGEINPDDVTQDDVAKVKDHITWRMSVLQTVTAKSLAKEFNQDLSLIGKDLIAHISKLAAEGIITENIALTLRQYLSEQQYQGLENQLKQIYLEN